MAGLYNPVAMRVRDLGEFGVIDLLNRMAVTQRRGPDNGAPFSFDLLVDTGDDTAVWQAGPVRELLTTDTMVEGVHFTRETTPWRDLGWKCLAANISDVAAMGGRPTFAVITLGLPPDTEVDALEELYQGMLEIGGEYGVAIVGGDTVRSPVFFVTVALTGVTAGQLMLRTNARPGDLVALTGSVGSSGGGLRLLLSSAPTTGPATGEEAEFLSGCHRRPTPAVAEGQVLVGAGITAAMDVSDGLHDDLSKLCRASGVAAWVEAGRVPVHPFLRRRFPDDYLGLALGGGEDYVLLFTGPAPLVGLAVGQLPEAAVIGAIEEGEAGRVTVVDSAGVELANAVGGWDHFR